MWGGANWGELGRIGAKWDGAGGAGREGMGAYVGVGGYTGGIRDGLQGSLWGGGYGECLAFTCSCRVAFANLADPSRTATNDAGDT